MFGDTTYIHFSVCIIVTGNLNSFLGMGADATLSIATKRSNDSVITTSFHNDTKRCINGWIDGWIASCKLLYITEIDRQTACNDKDDAEDYNDDDDDAHDEAFS